VEAGPGCPTSIGVKTIQFAPLSKYQLSRIFLALKLSNPKFEKFPNLCLGNPNFNFSKALIHGFS
jgi:hypothetical protein